jgi:hypothetical protein
MRLTSSVFDFQLRDGATLTFRAIHIDDPVPWARNPEGTSEDYFLIRYEGDDRLFHVSSRAPFKVEEVNLATPEGQSHREHVLVADQRPGA